VHNGAVEELKTVTIPRLRPEIQLLASTDGHELPFMALDERLEQRVRLDRNGMAICSSLTRSWQPDELLAHLHKTLETPLSPQLLVRFIRFLDHQLLLETERIARHIAAEELEFERDATSFRFLPGTSHKCVGCGHSCGGHDVGPISKERVQTISLAFPHARFREHKSGIPETDGHYCAMEKDQCLFLDDNQLCSIHLRLGAEEKPNDCRLFPLAFVATPREIVVGVRMECRSYLESKNNGGAFEMRSDEFQQMYDNLPWVERLPKRVYLDENLAIPYDDFVPIERALIESLQENSNLLWEGFFNYNAKARTLVTRALETERNNWVFPVEEHAKNTVTKAQLLSLISQACKTAMDLNAGDGNDLRAHMLKRVSHYLTQLNTTGLAPPTTDSRSNELIRDHLLQSIHLKSPARRPHLRYGLGLLNLTVILAHAGQNSAPSLNAALTDCLKSIRSEPVLAILHEHANAIAKHFHLELESWL
jgi:Fe-S-cluster containining protein